MFTVLLQPFIDYYESCEDREKIILVIGIPILIVLIVYMFVWEPISIKNQRLYDLLKREQRFTVWFDQNKQTYIPKNLTNQFDWSKNSLPSVVEKTIKDKQIIPWKNRIFQDTNQNTIVTFNDIPYDLFIKWVTDLEVTYQITFVDIDISAAKVSSQVNSKVVLSLSSNQLNSQR